MPDGEQSKRSRKGLVGTIVASVLIALFPFPVLFFAALGVPSGPAYALILGVWIAFVYFLAQVSLRGWPLRLRFATSHGVEWPHERVALLSFGLLLGWFLVWRIGGITDAAVGWLVWNVIVVVLYIEGSIVGSSRATGTPAGLRLLRG